MGVTASDDPPLLLDTSLGGDAMDSSGTLTRKRARATAGRVMASAAPSQSADNKWRSGYLHLAFMTDKDVVKEHAQQSRTDMKGKIDAHTRKDPRASFAADGGGPVSSAWVAEECDRVWDWNRRRWNSACSLTLRERRKNGN